MLVCVFAGLTVLAENEDATSHKFEWPPPPDHSVSVWTFLVISCCICIGVSAASKQPPQSKQGCVCVREVGRGFSAVQCVHLQAELLAPGNSMARVVERSQHQHNT